MVKEERKRGRRERIPVKKRVRQDCSSLKFGSSICLLVSYPTSNPQSSPISSTFKTSESTLSALRIVYGPTIDTHPAVQNGQLSLSLVILSPHRNLATSNYPKTKTLGDLGSAAPLTLCGSSHTVLFFSCSSQVAFN